MAEAEAKERASFLSSQIGLLIVTVAAGLIVAAMQGMFSEQQRAGVDRAEMRRDLGHNRKDIDRVERRIDGYHAD